MPLTPRAPLTIPGCWNIYGHSYFQTTIGTLTQQGRMDALFRDMLDIEYTNWFNRAVNGAKLVQEGRSTGGYSRVFQEVNKSTRTAPYAAVDGAAVICYGINDVGIWGSTTQTRDAFKSALRAVISRHRAAAVFEDSHASMSYGAGFTNAGSTEGFSSGTTVRQATTTTSATATLTIPSDYTGEPIVVCFAGAAGVFGGTVTFSGTAGVTGTISTSNIMPGGTTHCPVVRRITNLTSANAGQTIIMSATQIDASGSVHFDCWWLEAKAAPAVIVCDIAKLTATGYASYGAWSGTESAKDTDVNNWNADIAAVVGEFDSMVQIAYLDQALNKDATLLASDGVHPNEFGAAKCADALKAAQLRLTPISPLGPGASLNVPAGRQGSNLKPHRSGNWYSAEDRVAGTNYTAVAQDMFAMPLMITRPDTRIIQASIEAIASVTGTAIRWGIYDDVGATGYPQDLVVEATAGGAFTITSGAGVKTSPTSGAGSWNQPLDPGLYWVVVKFTTNGTSHTFRTSGGPNPYMPNCSSTGVRASYMGWKLTGQGTGAFSGNLGFPTGATPVDNCPVIGLKIN